jgi:hypothetical protein
MWFWIVCSVLVASTIAVAAFYDRRTRSRGYQLRTGGDTERRIAKDAVWKDPDGGGWF